MKTKRRFMIKYPEHASEIVKQQAREVALALYQTGHAVVAEGLQLIFLDNDWIKCSERMPDTIDSILFYCSHIYPNKMIGNHNGEHWFSRQHTDQGGDELAIELSEVTHWMPLPENPERE